MANSVKNVPLLLLKLPHKNNFPYHKEARDKDETACDANKLTIDNKNGLSQFRASLEELIDLSLCAAVNWK